ncbi:MAG: hypothetical protein J6P44_06540 [Bacteroidales bacterium]|nr:hypothetical protein [Bacteroidales bacterium]
MKKSRNQVLRSLLFALSASAICLFAACGDDDDDNNSKPKGNNQYPKNCVCEIGLDIEGDVYWTGESIAVKDYEGDCEDITVSDMPEKVQGDNTVIKCREEED